MNHSFEWGPFVLQTFAATLLSGSIVGLLLKNLIDSRLEKSRFTRAWKEQSLSRVIAPVVMHLNRTRNVRERYQKTYKEKTFSFLDAKLMRESNEAVRSILLSNGHLIPPDLRNYGHELVAHYDLWLLRFDAKVQMEQPSAESVFDVGFAEVRFPRNAAEAFEKSYNELRAELYGVLEPSEG